MKLLLASSILAALTANAGADKMPKCLKKLNQEHPDYGVKNFRKTWRKCFYSRNNEIDSTSKFITCWMVYTLMGDQTPKLPIDTDWDEIRSGLSDCYDEDFEATYVPLSLCHLYASQPDDPFEEILNHPNSDCNEDGSFKAFQADFEDEKFNEVDQPVTNYTTEWGSQRYRGKDYCVTPWRGRVLQEADENTDCQKVVEEALAEPDQASQEAHPCWYAAWKVYMHMEELGKIGYYGDFWQSSRQLGPIGCDSNGLFEHMQYLDRELYCFHPETGRPLGEPSHDWDDNASCPDDVAESNCLEQEYQRLKCADDGSGDYARYQDGEHWTGHAITYCVHQKTGVSIPCEPTEAIRVSGIWD